MNTAKVVMSWRWCRIEMLFLRGVAIKRSHCTKYIIVAVFLNNIAKFSDTVAAIVYHLQY